jgi:hypothetical protein
MSFKWTRGACVSADRFSPIVVVLTVNRRVAPGTWPLIVPCSSGVDFSWDRNNHIIKASWLGASNPVDGLSICFQRPGQCRRSVCVTAGCIPKNVNGVDVFFQKGAALSGARWMINGKAFAPFALSAAASNDVFWYGQTPPKYPFARPHAHAVIAHKKRAARHPTIFLLGRDARKAPKSTLLSAPVGASGVNLKWFLNPAGPYKRGIQSQGISWTNPPMAFEYTAQGMLRSRVFVLTCAASVIGAPPFYNGVEFVWRPSVLLGSSLVLAVPTFNNLPVTGFPASLIPQPPPSTNGVIFGFHHDDYDTSVWMPTQARLRPPGHTRIAILQG